MYDWKENINILNTLMNSMSVWDSASSEIDANEAFTKLKAMTLKTRETGRTIYFIGNGASASMSSHFSTDLEKNFNVRTGVFTDLSLITAIANDVSYEDVFAEPLRRKMVQGDMLVSISSSGNSPNVVKASTEARKHGGLVVTLSAMKHNNKIRSMGDLNFYVPAESYGMAETCHAAILHYWVDMMTGLLP